METEHVLWTADSTATKTRLSKWSHMLHVWCSFFFNSVESIDDVRIFRIWGLMSSPNGKCQFCCEAMFSIMHTVHIRVTDVLEWATCYEIRSFFKKEVSLEVSSNNLWWMSSYTMSNDFWSFLCLLELQSCPTCTKDLQMFLWPQDWPGDWLLPKFIHYALRTVWLSRKE